MNFKNKGNVILSVGAMVLAAASAVIGNMSQKAQMEETVAKEVAKAMSDKMKEV